MGVLFARSRFVYSREDAGHVSLPATTNLEPAIKVDKDFDLTLHPDIRLRQEKEGRDQRYYQMFSYVPAEHICGAIMFDRGEQYTQIIENLSLIAGRFIGGCLSEFTALGLMNDSLREACADQEVSNRFDPSFFISGLLHSLKKN